MKKIIFLIAIIYTSNMMYSQSVRDVLSTEDKLYGLSKLWQEINYNFAFIDRVELDIDSLYKATIPKAIEAKNSYDYYYVLLDYISHFKYGHTDITRSQWFWNEVDYPLFRFIKKSNKYFISQIDSSLIKTIPIGSEIISFDGIKIDKYPGFTLKGFQGLAESKFLLKLKKPDGTIIEHLFFRNMNILWRQGKVNLLPKNENTEPISNENFNFKIDKNNISLVELNSFSEENIIKQFKDVIGEINKTKGLVIDVRYNTGGNGDYAMEIAKYLVKENYVLTESWKIRKHHVLKKAYASIGITSPENPYAKKYKAYRNSYHWEEQPSDTIKIEPKINKVKVPIVLLVGKKTYSAAEDFLIYLYNDKSIKRIGGYIAGNSGQPLKITLVGGYRAKISAKKDLLPDGSEYIGIGLKPDFEITGDHDAKEFAIDYLIKH